MGYYDQPESVDVSLSFECSECGFENDKADGELLEGTCYATCEKCGEQNEWENDYEPCYCGDHCRC